MCVPDRSVMIVNCWSIAPFHKAVSELTSLNAETISLTCLLSLFVQICSCDVIAVTFEDLSNVGKTMYY